MDNKAWRDETLGKCLNKVKANIDNIGYSYPHVCLDGKYNNQGPQFWVSGFWGGILWLYYSQTKDEKAKELAEKLEEGLDPVLDGFKTLHHDVGFMWLPTSVENYRTTQNQASRLRALKAASHLAGRFNLSGRFIRAWNDETFANSQGWAIIDCMMNLSLLYWASKETNDPRFRHIAKAHSETVLKSFYREDGSVPHVVSFNPESGEKIENLYGQGYSGDSAWSRGQSWALYGMSIGYRETRDERFLEAAKKSAKYIIEHLPEDLIPQYDYTAPEDQWYAKDSSAAACTASGLIELSTLTEGEESLFYRNKAIDILKALDKNYSDYTDKTEAIIQKGTVSFPAGKFINTPIIYGDYFYIEALIKLEEKVRVF